jgi:hypothetical protein
MYSKYLDTKNHGVLGALGALGLFSFLGGTVLSVLHFLFS